MRHSENQNQTIQVTPEFSELLESYRDWYADPVEVHENMMNLLIPIIGTSDMARVDQQNLAHFVKLSSQVLYSLVSNLNTQ